MCCNDSEKKSLTIQEEWNSQSRREARSAFIKGDVPARCKSCVSKAKKDLGETLPIHMNNAVKTFEKSEVVSTPRYLHISPSNKCNLACKMCSPQISSMYGRRTTGEIINDNTDGLLEYIAAAAPTLDHYVFHGGDPLYEGNIIPILEILKPYDTNINVISNGTVKNLELIEMLKDFSEVKITVSLDGTPRANDYMRTYTKTSRVYENYNRFCKELPHATMGIHTVHSNISVLSMREFYESIGGILDRVDEASHYALECPIIYAMRNLPEAYRERVREDLSKAVFQDDPLGRIYEKAAEMALQELSKPFLPALWAEFLEKNRWFDQQFNRGRLIDVLNIRDS